MIIRKGHGLQVADLSLGYVCFVYPEFLKVPFYLYGDEFNTPYSPIEFR